MAPTPSIRTQALKWDTHDAETDAAASRLRNRGRDPRTYAGGKSSTTRSRCESTHNKQRATCVTATATRGAGDKTNTPRASTNKPKPEPCKAERSLRVEDPSAMQLGTRDRARTSLAVHYILRCNAHALDLTICIHRKPYESEALWKTVSKQCMTRTLFRC
jgi:hypothetical protein